MKVKGNTQRLLYVFGLALIGLSFYVAILALVVFGAMALFSRHAHAAEPAPPPVVIDAGFTGSWFDPANSGQGLMLEVLPNHQLLAIWLAFDPSGRQTWFGGVGTYEGNTATLEAVLPTGGRWLPAFDASQVQAQDWGSMTFTFTDRNRGRVDFQSKIGFGAGGADLVRLTELPAHRATDTPIGQPAGIAAAADGSVYFSSSPDRIYRIGPDGALSRIGGSGQPGYSGDGGPATRAQFNFPLSYSEFVNDPVDYAPLVGGLAVDSAGNVFVADAYNNRVRRIDANGIVTTVFGTGARANAGDGGAGTLAPVYWPLGVAVDANDTLYVTSAYGPLRRLDANGIVATLTQSNCGAGYLGPGLCAPTGIALDAAHNVYAADGYCRVRRVGSNGSVATVAGADQKSSNGYAFTCGYSGDGQSATSAALSVPYGVAVAANGTLYIADTDNDCIRKVAGGVIDTFAGICTHGGFGGDGGNARLALLDHPRGVAVGGDGSVYIADTDNQRVRRVAPDGVITTIAGNGAALPAPGAIGPWTTGSWFDPAQSGHGLMIEAISENRLLAYWTAFDPQGNQVWFGGLGTYSGNTATIDAIISTGGSWFLFPTFAPTPIALHDWGTLKFTFSGCDEGKVEFDSVYDSFGSGSMNLTRLTQPAGLACP